MAPRMSVGSFAARTTTGNQSVVGVGFQPNALLMWSSGAATTGFSDGVGLSVGVAASSSEQAACAINIRDGFASGSDTSRYGNTGIIASQVDTAGSAVTASAALVSFDGDGFTLNWTQAPASALIHNYLAVATQDSYVGSFNTPTSASSVQVSGVGFMPDAVILLSVGATGLTVGTSAELSVGMTSGINEDWCTHISDPDAQATTQVVSQGTNKALVAAGGAMVATLQSFDADGFSLAFSAAPGTARKVFYLALKGGRYYVGNFTQGSTGSQLVSSPFLPEGAVLLGTGATATTVQSDKLGLAIGASDGGDSRATWVLSQDAVTTSNSSSWTGTDLLTFGSAAKATLARASEADLTGLGAQLVWATNDSVARRIGFLAVGGNTLVADEPFYRCGATGNDRHLITGIARESCTLRWRIDGGAWVTKSLVADDAYSYWIENGFVAGRSYRVEVQTVSGSLIDVLFDDSMVWSANSYSLIESWLSESPEWVRSSEMAQAVWTAYASQQGDLYAMFDDIEAQSDPLRSTWSLPVWEEIVGISVGSSKRTLDQRRRAVMSRRVPGDGTRTDFFEAINSILGIDPAITDSYSLLRADVRLPTGDQDLRSLVESVVAAIKPVGLLTVASFGEFRAGVSKAGDPL